MVDNKPDLEYHNIYKEIEKDYTTFVCLILEENTKLVDNRYKEKKEIERCKILERGIIPNVEGDPKTNFLTTSKANYWTKDDPILRFIPSIKTNNPTCIMWYEGSEIGEKPQNLKDTVDKIFLEKEKYSADAYKFIGKPQENKKVANMKNLFCNVCLLFNCGIHQISPGTCLHFEEETKCICNEINETDEKINKSIKEIVREFRDGNDIEMECDDFCDIQNTSLTSIKTKDINGVDCDLIRNKNVDNSLLKHLFCLRLKGCVIKKITNILTDFTFNCNEIVHKKMPIKNFERHYKEIQHMEFYKPCKHSGPCTKKNCSCARNEISCELSCFCSGCKLIKFCSCSGKCTEKCACLSNNRFCNPELCGCIGCASGGCDNVFSDKYKKTLVGRSTLHGFGLFCDEEIIKENEYVMEYVGEIISDKEAERRGNFYEANNCSYLFNQVNEGGECLYSLDAYTLGNKSRYINHGKEDANLKTAVMVDKGITKIIFKAKRDIYKGEEFLFDYQFSYEAQRKHGMIHEE